MSRLNKITCSVGLDYTRGWHLVNEKSFYTQLTEETTAHLRDMGLNVAAGVPGKIEGIGAGGGLFAIIQNLIKFEPVAQLIATILGFTQRVYFKVIGDGHQNAKQAITINLDLTHNGRVKKDDDLYELPFCSAIAFDAGVIEQRRLAKKYPLYEVKLTITVNVPKNGFSTTYYLGTTKHSELNRYRMSRIIRSVKFNGGDNLYISSSKYGTIQHIFNQSHEIQNSPYGPYDWRFVSTKAQTYYTYLSSEMFRGYKRDNQVINWTNFKKQMKLT